MRIATNVISVVAGLLLAVAAPVSAESAASPVDLGPECEAILATLPAAEAEPEAAGWPHHDPLLDAMVPDVIGDQAQWHILATGAHPDDESMIDRQLAIAAGRDPADYRAVWALPESQPQSVYAIRVVGATPRSTLDAILTNRVFRPSPDETLGVYCTGTVIDGQAALGMTHSPSGTALLLPFADAWLVATAEPDRLTTLEPELREHLVRLATTGVEPAPRTAPEMGTRIAPPASATDLALALPVEFDGVPINYLGQDAGQLGVGMVPYAFVGGFDPIIRAISPDLDVDLSLVWGDTGASAATGTASPAVSFSVLSDPTGDGARWVEPYANVHLDRDTFLPDPEAPRLFPKGYLKKLMVGGKHLVGGGSDEQGWYYLYASGPWFFTIQAGTAAQSAELLASLP